MNAVTRSLRPGGPDLTVATSSVHDFSGVAGLEYMEYEDRETRIAIHDETGSACEQVLSP